MKTSHLCLLIISLICLLSSCKCPEVLTETRVEYRDTTIVGATVSTRVDTIERIKTIPGQERVVYREGKPYTVVKTVEDPESKAKLTILKGAYGELLAECQAKDQLIEKISERKSEVHHIEIYKTPPWAKLTIGILASLLVFIGLKKAVA